MGSYGSHLSLWNALLDYTSLALNSTPGVDLCFFTRNAGCELLAVQYWFQVEVFSQRRVVLIVPGGQRKAIPHYL